MAYYFETWAEIGPLPLTKDLSDDQNRLDGNAIIGPWTGGLENFHVACGFSGHGLMHAPAVGLAVSELLLDGRFSTIDLSRLGYRRVVDGTPLPEQGII